jgi:hypothetical protein
MTMPAETTRPTRVRPRYGRLTAFCSALLVTFVTLLGGLGLLPSGTAAASAAPRSDPGAMSLTANIPERGMSQPSAPPQQKTDLPGNAAQAPSNAAADVPLPDNSGDGRRVVFDMSDQRVWLVDKDGSVARSYLVSGSMGNNLKAGTYTVYSRSMDALGIDGTTMHYMVRFAHGVHAPIGFHDIPLMHGKRVQTKAQLGIPKSHGCIRQWHNDAVAMWHFAPIGTKVVVTA